MRKYFTTAIPYLNGPPHIGHALDYLNADTAARWARAQGAKVRLQAGTDEHGNKVAKKAQAAGKSEQEFVDENAEKFRDFIARLGVEATDFIRTSDPNHMRRCQLIWQKLTPYIYKHTYHGWYCEGCEQFVTAKEAESNGGVCPDHESTYVELNEENYYLKISVFKDRIKKAIEAKEMQILPEFRKREVLALLENAPDVSISRPRAHLSWGIPVPGDEEQVMYVWIDALANYLTVLGYPDETDDNGLTLGGWWPAEAQFVGKDILRFHTIIWPAMLLALGLPLPKTIHSHGFVQVNAQKISKSLGNTIDPLAVIAKYGLTAFRYYFLRHVDTFADTDFTWEKFDAAYNDELANDYGNLVQRLATLAQRNAFALRETEREEFTLGKIAKDNADFPPEFVRLMDGYYFSKALDCAWRELQQLNRDINDAAPWNLAKNGETAKLRKVLRELILKLLQANRMLAIFLPNTGERVVEIFTSEWITAPEKPLFPKLK